MPRKIELVTAAGSAPLCRSERAGSARALCAALLMAAAGLAQIASAEEGEVSGSVDVEVRASRGGLPTEGAAGSEPVTSPEPVAIDFLTFEFEFVPIGSEPVGQGSLDEGLARQVPISPPETAPPVGFASWEDFAEQAEAGAQRLIRLVAAFKGLDLFGVLSNPDPFLAFNVAYDNPDGTLTDPTRLQHFASSSIVPRDAVQDSVAVLGLVVEDADGDGDAAAQAFHGFSLGGLSGRFAGGQISLQEPGFDVVVVEAGAHLPDLGPQIDSMALDVDVIVGAGDRAAVFAAVFLDVPEPSSLQLGVVALGVLALLWQRSSKRGLVR